MNPTHKRQPPKRYLIQVATQPETGEVRFVNHRFCRSPRRMLETFDRLRYSGEWHAVAVLRLNDATGKYGIHLHGDAVDVRNYTLIGEGK